MRPRALARLRGHPNQRAEVRNSGATWPILYSRRRRPRKAPSARGPLAGAKKSATPLGCPGTRAYSAVSGAKPRWADGACFTIKPLPSPTRAVTVLTPLLTARAVAVEDGSAHARWLGRRWVGGWFFGGCSRRRLSRREGTAAQATALVGSCGAGRFARAAAMRRPA